MPEHHRATGGAIIRRAIVRHRRRLLIGYPLIILWQLAETLVPVVIGLVIDQAVDGGSVGDLAWTLAVMVALFAVLSNGYRYGSRFVVRSMETEGHLLRLEISRHVLHPRGVRSDRLTGETLSLATSDARLVPLVMRQLGFALASLTSIVVVAVYVLQVDVTLGLLILLGVPGTVAVIQLLAPLVAARARRQQERTATAAGLAGDLLQGLRPLKGIGGEDVALRRYRAASQDASRATISVARSWGYLSGLTAALSGLLLAAVALVAGREALAGNISLGELVALVGLTQFLAEPIRALGDFSAQFAASRASAGRIAAFLRSPRILRPGRQEPATERPHLHLSGAVRHPLSGLDLEVTPGEIVAVTIDDPAASDTLIGVLSGEQELESGHARLGDVDLAELTIESRRRHLLVVSHHTEVFEGTLRTTVDPLERHDDSALAPVLAASAADEVVGLHPDGLQRSVRAGGASLSGGQRQRLALARALATDAPVLVLQDPTSAVDAVTEQTIAEGLRTVRSSEHATVVITSSPAWLQRADRVVVVREGRVVASGTHTELMAGDDYREAVAR
ncbi:ABC transporter transmembrane domain-containing protein [Aeromicrobium sp. CTD01-1L150]|uniref:ABC transporter transmembrane domain-containing protein n=1 Tax=Aeromicrobium sp. CTD01-1L150 TaxID=3341830 RepID=UPI0035C1E983